MPKVGRLHSGNIKTHIALHLSAFLNILLAKVIGETNSTKHSNATSKGKCFRYILLLLFFFFIIIIIIIIIIIKMPIKYHVLIQNIQFLKIHAY